MLPSYPKIFNLGHAAVKDIFSTPVIVEEKVDGSQFSFSLLKSGELIMQSKRARLIGGEGGKLFNGPMDTVLSLMNKMVPGWIYRGEAVASRRHNSLTYDRTPKGFIVIYDIDTAEQDYLSREDKKRHVEDVLGLECVPQLSIKTQFTKQTIDALLSTTSFLGGQLIEGFVIKPETYDLFGSDGKVLMAKVVSESFKEKNSAAFKKTTSKDIIADLAATVGTIPRFNKAIMTMEEDGVLSNEPKDIGELMKRVAEDIREEETEYLLEEIVKHLSPEKILRSVIRKACSPIPHWYKERLIDHQFEGEAENVGSVDD